MRLNIEYERISNILRDHNIFFTASGIDRHKPTDKIVFDDSNIDIEPYSAFLGGANLWSMGSFSYSWSTLPINARVGRYCSIARGMTVLGARHPIEWVTTSSSTYDNNFVIFKKFAEDFNTKHITYPRNPSVRRHGLIIENDVWIGANVCFKNDIVVGTGAVIAANSVVVKDVPPYAIVGGNPAKIIKYRFTDYQIVRLLSTQWWEYAMTDVQSLDFRNIDKFCDDFLKNKSQMEMYTPPKLSLLDLGLNR
ncbi:CatB-related O-acetyltransferase [Actinobacillus genomosp. 1]|uniref:CatB-related O-acetyltransferase n=1 Tax=Actinobacillus genomosp. 1 TaxID=254839 RepID=UPI0024433051|nr:CatB-related O-acetyltransferase [Actinobacillus genomosp. 1]WGE90848.1 CatB-related O-acetyltransferase [Actinobacillus genomosp. 1]